MRLLCDRLDLTARTRLLDIGGTYYNWSLLPPKSRPRLTLLNLGPRPHDLPEGVDYLQGNALALPCRPGDFDVVFSNSVIEHVGSWDAQQRFARELRRLGGSYWVQTPNYFFPVEPHVLGLGVQFLPRSLARPYVRWCSAWGWFKRPGRAAVDAELDDVRLLNDSEMRALFPESTILRERVLGLTKSLIAVHRAGDRAPS